MMEWKTRFNYTWDWTPRLVQIGIWDSISLAVVNGGEMKTMRCTAGADPGAEPDGWRSAAKSPDCRPEVWRLPWKCDALRKCVARDTLSIEEFARGERWKDLPVELWWPNLAGPQPLYTLTCRLLDAQGCEQDRLVPPPGLPSRRVAAVRRRPAGGRPLGVRRQRAAGLPAGRQLPPAEIQLRRPAPGGLRAAPAPVRRPGRERLPHQRLPVPGAGVVLRPVRRAGPDGLAGVSADLLGHRKLAAGGRDRHRRDGRDCPLLYQPAPPPRCADPVERRQRAAGRPGWLARPAWASPAT